MSDQEAGSSGDETMSASEREFELDTEAYFRTRTLKAFCDDLKESVDEAWVRFTHDGVRSSFFCLQPIAQQLFNLFRRELIEDAKKGPWSHADNPFAYAWRNLPRPKYLLGILENLRDITSDEVLKESPHTKLLLARYAMERFLRSLE